MGRYSWLVHISRPFRANSIFHFPQGVALGSYIAPRWGFSDGVELGPRNIEKETDHELCTP